MYMNVCVICICLCMFEFDNKNVIAFLLNEEVLYKSYFSYCILATFLSRLEIYE